MLFHRRGLSICGFGTWGGSWNQFLTDMKGWLYYYSQYSSYKAAVSNALANTDPSLLAEMELWACEPVLKILWSTYQHTNLLCVHSCLKTVQFSHSVVSNSLRPHEPQHARPPCPSPTPGVHPNSCPSSRWCHPAISSSVVPFSSCPQFLPASESCPVS